MKKTIIILIPLLLLVIITFVAIKYAKIEDTQTSTSTEHGESGFVSFINNILNKF